MTPVIGDSGKTTEVAFPVIFQHLLEFIRRNEGFFRLMLIDYLEFNALHLEDVAAKWNVVLDDLLSRVEHLKNLRRDRWFYASWLFRPQVTACPRGFSRVPCGKLMRKAPIRCRSWICC